MAILGALATGMALGLAVGALVVVANLSSLIATLGMNFMLRGFIMIVTQGKSIAEKVSHVSKQADEEEARMGI